MVWGSAVRKGAVTGGPEAGGLKGWHWHWYIYIHSTLISSDTLLFITYFLPTVTGHLMLQPTRPEEKTKSQKGGGTQKNLGCVSSSLVLAL